MADREARVRLQLSTQSFVAGMQRVGKSAAQAGESIHQSLNKAATEGLAKVRSGLQGLGGQLKGLAGQAATLGGAVGVGKLLQDGVGLQTQYMRVALALERATGQAHSLTDVQEAISQGASKTSRTQAEMADAMRVMLDRGADPTFALQSLESVGRLMNVTGQDAERTGRVLAGMSNKFGVSGQQASQMLDAVMKTAGEGRISIEELFEDFNEFGSIAHHAGLRGKEGMQLTMAMVAKMGPELNGTTSEISAGLDIFTERLRDVGILERVFKNAGASLDKQEFGGLKGMKEQADYLMKAGPKVMQLFKEEFTGREEASAFNAYFAPYFAELEKAKASGMTEAEAASAASRAVEKNLQSMSARFAESGKAAEASARVQETAEAKLRAAYAKVVDAIASEEGLAAIDSLAENLPALAKALAGFVDFAVKNPLLAGTGVLGGKMALDFSGGALQALLQQAGAQGGTTMGSTAASTVAGSSKLAVAGRALGIAAAAMVAYELGKFFIDRGLDQETKGQDAAAVAAAHTGGSGDLKGKRAALAGAKAELARLQQADPMRRAMGGLINLGADIGLVGDDERTNFNQEQPRRQFQLQQTIAKLESQIEQASKPKPEGVDKLDQSAAKGADSLAKLSVSMMQAAQAAQQFARVPAPAGTNGLPNPAPPGSGSGPT